MVPDTSADDVSGQRAQQIFAELCECADWPAGRRPTLVLDATVDARELGCADYGTRAVRVSPLLLTLSEDHVASLLAHELGHLAHGPVTLSPGRRRAALLLVLSGILCVLAGAVTNALTTAEAGRHWWTLPLVFGGAVLALCAPAMPLAQNRQAELLADRYAARLLHKTPWDATAILRDAVTKERAVWSVARLYPVRIVLRLMSTHPSHRHRLERMHVE